MTLMREGVSFAKEHNTTPCLWYSWTADTMRSLGKTQYMFKVKPSEPTLMFFMGFKKIFVYYV